MTEKEQRPRHEALHWALLDAIKKYEAVTGWTVVDLRLYPRKGVNALDIVAVPISPR